MVLKNNNIILGIETSFDDTSCAILKGNIICSNITYTQKLHNEFKGVKPNLAYNLHLVKIYEIVRESIDKSKIKIKDINAISYTKGPGLIGSLMVGENFSKSMALSLNIPLIGVNHIHGHIFSNFIYNREKIYPKFPYICFSLSGGHTKIFLIKNFLDIKEIGRTLDDSLGNLFDKLSIYLGFEYYNGPRKIEEQSKKGKFLYKFPIPKVKGLNFSFSGLITYLKRFIKKNKKRINKKDLCKSFIETIFIILKDKIYKAIKKTKIKNLVITGGVSYNEELNKKIKKISYKNKWKLYINKNKDVIKDNAAMIALVGNIKYYYKYYDNYNTISISNLKSNKL
ncbi:MAG: tRNA (adenosine(37)-N6)-threonylcarbamoyltransferase complex transferase subunit TsaD [Candidatus Shikimatogenerans bostrichidophilus]|nr:MAG: tRNA (adenosine(37)-N6)-threonylcarbamoyltransferase complex transferase subunit TsaD [Candidatus Shikimatogenerans bostrichidophilus]